MFWYISKVDFSIYIEVRRFYTYRSSMFRYVETFNTISNTTNHRCSWQQHRRPDETKISSTGGVFVVIASSPAYLFDFFSWSTSREAVNREGSHARLPPLSFGTRYMYYSPQGSRVNVKSSERKTSPFNTFWYIRLGDGGVTSRVRARSSDLKQREWKMTVLSPACWTERTWSSTSIHAVLVLFISRSWST